MAFSTSEATEQVQSFFDEEYQVIAGQVIPSISDLPLDNTGKQIDLCMLFIDLRESTRIGKALKRETIAKMYKSFLWGISKIARENNGEPKSFNGDGVLIVFHGLSKEAHAVKAAMQMSYYITQILKPRIQNYIKNSIKLLDLDFSFGIGVDTGTILVVRGGIRGEGNNDLVWAGNATNQAVKLSALSKGNIDNKKPNIFISEGVYAALPDSLKVSKKNGLIIGNKMWVKKQQGILPPNLNSLIFYYTNYYIKLP